IYNPSSVLIADSGAGSIDVAVELAVTAKNGRASWRVSGEGNEGGVGGKGDKRLYFAQFPGAFAVPAGDEGGTLASGGAYDGTVQVGDLDLWSFTASTGNRCVVRIGGRTATTYFNPWLRIYNPNGVLIADSGVGIIDVAVELAVTATNSGT